MTEAHSAVISSPIATVFILDFLLLLFIFTFI